MALINPECIGGPGLCSRSDALTSDRQGTTTANRQNRKKLSFKLHLPPMKLETMSSTILLRKYHRILSTRQNQLLLLLLYFQNQKKGRKLQKLQKYLYLHLHPHWRQSRNSPTLQDQESQRERTLEGQPVHIVTFTCKMVIKTLSQSGLVNYQSEKLNFGLYIVHTRAGSAICRDPGVEERPNGITVHSLPPTGRRGGFNSNTTTCDLFYQKVVAAHGLLGLSRLSNRKGVKTILPFETNTKSLEESPASPSTTGCRSPQVRPSIHSQRSERSAPSIHMHFPFIGSMTSRSRTTSERSGLNGGKASDWLRPESTA